MWCRNNEGYRDYTAGIAMSHASKEERKEQKMAKKRNCRRTVDEDRIHEKAVKLRKMTDEQPVNIPEIIEEIGNVKGIGATKLADIKCILEKRLAGEENG